MPVVSELFPFIVAGAGLLALMLVTIARPRRDIVFQVPSVVGNAVVSIDQARLEAQR